MHWIRIFLLVFAAAATTPAAAQQTVDWGVIPIGQDTTISFARYDITSNFTDVYRFSLQGTGNAGYAVTVNFHVCARGCGSPELSYGMYALNGSLIDSSGSVVLGAGDYSFQVKGSGFGAGNSVDYWGNMSFSVATAPAAEGNFASAVPEPSDIVLMALGLSFLVWAMRRRRHASRGRAGWAAAGLLVALGIAGCTSRVETSQVVARVNGDEISHHQLDFGLAEQRKAIGKDGDRGALLEKMIDRQLAVQQALQLGLDRRPEVMLRIEEARRDILAAAYAGEVAGRQTGIDEGAAARYYAEHPGLFAQRRIYRLREVTVPRDGALGAEVDARLTRRERVAEIAAWVREQRSGYAAQIALRTAEQLPIEIADHLVRLKTGDTVAFRAPRALILYELIASEPAPIAWNAAAPIIRAHLERQAGTRVLDEDLKRLRAAAQITRREPPRAQSPGA